MVEHSTISERERRKWNRGVFYHNIFLLIHFLVVLPQASLMHKPGGSHLEGGHMCRFGWAMVRSDGWARSPLVVAGVLAQWLEAHRR